VPTKRTRRVRSRRAGALTLRASIRHFLETGDLSAATAENPWFAVTLTDVDDVRSAWARGDEELACALLAQIPGGRNCFA
jgi:hypothetical protein